MKCEIIGCLKPATSTIGYRQTCPEHEDEAVFERDRFSDDQESYDDPDSYYPEGKGDQDE